MKPKEIKEQIEFIDTFLRIYSRYLSNESLIRLGMIKDTMRACLPKEEVKPKPKEVKKE